MAFTVNKHGLKLTSVLNSLFILTVMPQLTLFHWSYH